MKIPFTKAHGAKNDFLLTWRRDAPEDDLPRIARVICERHTGVGADGWILVTPAEDADAAIELYNSDGSAAALSGNGTRCAAALLVRHGLAPGVLRIRTGAGIKTLRLLGRSGLEFQFEMNMGRAEVRDARFYLRLAAETREVAIVWVGNPQCAVPVENFDFDWRKLGAEIGSHSAFPDRTNVSFVRAVDEHSIEVRFFERGAGETMSSGTGSAGAAAAAVAWAMAKWPVRVDTPAGPLEIRFQEDIYLAGPAAITGEGEFFL